MKKVFAPRTYKRFAEAKKGDSLIDGAAYLRSEEGKFGKPNHIFESDSGEIVLNSSGKLDYLIENFLEPGMRCKIVYNGMVTLDKGIYKGKTSHDFELWIDDKDGEAVEALPSKKTIDAPVISKSNLASDLFPGLDGVI